MDLRKITPENILNRPAPIEELLKDSVYYPACGTDGRPIKYCNTIWRHLDVNSFVYCDFDISEEKFLKDMHNLHGYHVLAHRNISKEEYIPQDWSLELPGTDAHKYTYTFLGLTTDFLPFAHWVVYERNENKGALHGPERLSLLYIGGEGLATFQQLYVSRHIAPKMLCFIQCWGFAGNWTDFTNPQYSFAETIRRHCECTPEWICLGDCGNINGVQHLKGTEYLGVKAIAFSYSNEYERDLGCRGVSIYSSLNKNATVYQANGRSYLSLSVMHFMTPVLYDITDSPYDVDTIVNELTLREEKFQSEEAMLNNWIGFEKPTELELPNIRLRITDKSVHKANDVAQAINIIDVLDGFYKNNPIDIYTGRMCNYLQNALDTLKYHLKDEKVRKVFEKGESLMEHMTEKCSMIGFSWIFSNIPVE